MGIRNYLIEGLSGTGRTSVCNELQRRGDHAIHSHRELAYQGDPETGEPTTAWHTSTTFGMQIKWKPWSPTRMSQ
jgi:broad-specificity NMP kinase